MTFSSTLGRKAVFFSLMAATVVATAGWAYQAFQPGYRRVEMSALYQRTGSQVIILGMPQCPHCQETVAWLQQQRVDHRYWDAEASAEARSLMQTLKPERLPVVLIGERRIDGFREKAIREALMQLRRPVKG